MRRHGGCATQVSTSDFRAIETSHLIKVIAKEKHTSPRIPPVLPQKLLPDLQGYIQKKCTNNIALVIKPLTEPEKRPLFSYFPEPSSEGKALRSAFHEESLVTINLKKEVLVCLNCPFNVSLFPHCVAPLQLYCSPAVAAVALVPT
jgi:hypothetical protein